MPRFNFPVNKIALVAENESWRKEVNRPIYHIHKWWAQRLGSIFRAMLLYLANDGKTDIWNSYYSINNFKNVTVFDPFMGSGTTLGEAIKLGMNSIGCDINPISFFLVKQELTRVPVKVLKKEFTALEKRIAHKIKDCYKTIDLKTGKHIPVLYYFWVKIVTTPNGEEIPLFSRYVFSQNAYPSKKPEAQILCPSCWNVFQGLYNQTKCTCPKCKKEFNPQCGPAKKTTVISKSGEEYKIKDLVSSEKALLKEKMYAVLCVNEKGDKQYQPVQDYDIKLFNNIKISLAKSTLPLPRAEVSPGFNTDQARGYNYFHWRDFFNARQKYCLGLLLQEITKIENDDVREHFLCLFSSTLEFNNTFCSFKGEGTGAVRPIFSNHILKPERQPLENSIWGINKSSGCFSTLFSSKLLKAKEYLDFPFEVQISNEKNGKIVASNPINVEIKLNHNEFEKEQKQKVLLLNGDSSKVSIPDESVDFVVTDPPYFDFIHYSELSDFFYAWLAPVLQEKYPCFRELNSRRKNEVQQTDANIFSNLLGNVFLESNRVLKEKGKLAFSFHHSKINGWLAIANALKKANFFLKETFPVHAELMASTPKAGAKEPISLDAMIICQKKQTKYSLADIKKQINTYIDDYIKNGKKLSKADIFVITASQCLCMCVNQKLNNEDSSKLIEEVYKDTLSMHFSN